jgi:putative acetyltransferase
MISVRPASTADRDAIREVEAEAFGRTDEALLVEELRAAGCVVLELVAEAHGKVVGHILFSDLPIESAERTIAAVALAPMAVSPPWQRRGVGGALILMSLPMLLDKAREAVIVLGHPDYYPQFGFSAELVAGLEGPFSGPALMGLELKPCGLAEFKGRLRYADAFGLES